MGPLPIPGAISREIPEDPALLLAHQPGRPPVGDLPPRRGRMVLGERLARPRHCREQFPRPPPPVPVGTLCRFFPVSLSEGPVIFRQ